MRILLLAASQGPDYLQDLVIHGLTHTKSFSLFFNFFPPYLAVDYTSTIQLYGRGFTAFRNIGPSYNYWKKKQVQTKAQEQLYDLAIYLNVQRYYDDDEAKWLRSRGCIVFALDGEDNTDIVSPALERCNIYFKRELVYSDERIRPISFKIPSNVIIPLLKPSIKTCLLAPCDPRHRHSYVFDTQDSYYEQYSKSYFGFTMKKGGWDCMRHYEILAAGALPHFLDYESKPATIMMDYPDSLQIAANKLYENMVLSTKNLLSWEEEYVSISINFRSWLEVHGVTSCYSKIFMRAFMGSIL